MSGSCILVISWSDEDIPGLPRFVGPFDNPDEAQRCAALNAARATYSVQPLTYPYMRTGDGSHVYIDLTGSSNVQGGNDARF